MTASILSTLGAGFSNQALGSQAVFRAVLQAFAHPGRSVTVVHDAQTPAVGQPASAALLLALLDGDCSVWLSARLAASTAGAWLRFHTGCTVVREPGLANFAWVAQGDALPALHGLAQGSDRYPDQSATCVVDVARTLEAPPAGPDGPDGPAVWHVSGPGIREQARLQVDGLPDDFVPRWQANHAAFPRGVDLLLATPGHVLGLPRTTRIVRIPDTGEV